MYSSCIHLVRVAVTALGQKSGAYLGAGKSSFHMLSSKEPPPIGVMLTELKPIEPPLQFARDLLLGSMDPSFGFFLLN